MANTVIQLKYSELTSTPVSLNTAEPAYSNNSGKLFIGDGNDNVIAIGGEYYTSIIDLATDSNTPSTLVKRDSDGSFYANVVYANIVGTIEGTSNTANKLTTARDIGLAGDATGNVSFDGSQNVTLTVDLTNTGVSSGTYGGATQIPTFVVDEEGRLTSAANVAISTSLSVKADTGDNTISLATDTLTFVGGDGITTSIDPTDNVKIDVDNTVIRTTGNQTITGDFTISGNLNVQGNTVTHDVDTLVINDPIILLANNNPDNIVDIGFVAHYEDGSANTKHTGLIRDVSSNTWYLFEGYEPHVQEEHLLNVADPTLVVSNLKSNLIDSTIYNATINSLASDLSVADGGTGASSFTAGGILIGNGSSALQILSNTSSSGTYANASHVPVITVDDYGRVSSVTNTAIAIDAAAITSGTLPIARGGTNQTTYTAGGLVVYDGTSLTSFANSTYTLTGGLATSNTVTSITVDDYGRLTAVTGQEISISASQITSGTLSVDRGGTGAASFTANGVIIAGTTTTGALSSVASSVEGQVLQINSSGIPVFGDINGGSF